MIAEKLSKQDINIKLTQDEEKNIVVTVSNKTLQSKNTKETKKESIFGKVMNSFIRVCEKTFDEITKTFLKKQYKIKNSVYTDSKNGIKAVIEGDIKKAITKISDAALGLLKKGSRRTKKDSENCKKCNN